MNGSGKENRTEPELSDSYPSRSVEPFRLGKNRLKEDRCNLSMAISVLQWKFKPEEDTGHG